MKKALFTTLAVAALGSASFAQTTPAKKAGSAKTATTGVFKAKKPPLYKPAETKQAAPGSVEKKTEVPTAKAKKAN